MRNRTRNYSTYRHPRTTQERRNNCRYNDKWGRTKRNWRNLPNDYDDDYGEVQKTWKVRRLHQYHEGGRGTKHVIFIPSTGKNPWNTWFSQWKLEEYFRDNSIPHNIQRIEKREYEVVTHKSVLLRVPYEWSKPVWVRRKLRKPRTRYWSTTLGWEITWWYNKDIGIDKVLQSCSNNYWIG